MLIGQREKRRIFLHKLIQWLGLFRNMRRFSSVFGIWAITALQDILRDMAFLRGVEEHDIFQTELIQWLGSVRSGTCRALLAFVVIWSVKTPQGYYT